MSGAGPVDGAGIVESVYNASQHLDDPGLFTLDAVSVGLDALGIVLNPLGALASAGVGFLIEHVAFLHEALDDLAGDPGAVARVAALWGESVRAEVSSTADEIERSLALLREGWTGPGAQAYEGLAEQVRSMVGATAAACGGLGTAVQGSGILVATARALIRDLVADVVGELVAAFVAALAASWFTLGGSVAAFITWGVARGAAVAAKITAKVADLVEQLAEVLRRLAGLSGAADGLRAAARGLDDVATRLGSAVAGRGSAIGVTEGNVDALNGLLRRQVLRLDLAPDQLAGLGRLSDAVSPGDGELAPGLNPSGAAVSGGLDAGNTTESQ